jgi:hypothetical protein
MDIQLEPARGGPNVSFVNAQIHAAAIALVGGAIVV